MLVMNELQGLFPNIRQEGFSAYKDSLSVSTTTKVGNWSTTAPYFKSSHFNATSGNYIAPVDGVYAILATISYVANTAISIELGANMNPYLSIARIGTPNVDLVKASLPVFDTSLLLLTLRTLLRSSTLTLTTVQELTAGDTLGLLYNADTLNLGITLTGIQWTVFRVKEED